MCSKLSSSLGFPYQNAELNSVLLLSRHMPRPVTLLLNIYIYKYTYVCINNITVGLYPCTETYKCFCFTVFFSTPNAAFFCVVISREGSSISSSVVMTSAFREGYTLLQVSACALLLLESIMKPITCLNEFQNLPNLIF
jgi:hypothetical protein